MSSTVACPLMGQTRATSVMTSVVRYKPLGVARRAIFVLLATSGAVAFRASPALSVHSRRLQQRHRYTERSERRLRATSANRPRCRSSVLAAETEGGAGQDTTVAKDKAGGRGAAGAATVNIAQVSEELLAVRDEAVAEFSAAQTLQELEDLRRKYLTKKGPVQKVMGQMRLLSSEDKPKLGKVSNEVKAELEKALRDRKDAVEDGIMQKQIEDDWIDVTLPGLLNGRRSPMGHRHPISIMMELATDVFVDMGYTLVDGVDNAPEIENDFYCFEALNCPKDHPARAMQDTFYLEPVADEDPLLLRTHTSSVQIRALERMKPPLAIVAPGRVYRRDTPDATHNPEFHQIEILHVEEAGNLHLGHLRGTVEHFLRKMFGPDMKTRFRGSYFPFTEPSFEVDIWFKGRWMEVLGCGMVDPRVLRKAGVDPEEYVGFAAGFGVERFAMALFGVSDLRLFWQSDPRFLSQFPGNIQGLKDAVKYGSLGEEEEE